MHSNSSDIQGDSFPVEDADWNDCQSFISKLNSISGRHFRLPTEAEWEYAARGGNLCRHYKYSGSNNLSEVAWYDENSGKEMHPVGKKTPNELGLYDMSGNAWEWCSDWFGNYNNNSQTNPKGPVTGSDHVVRGGCCRSLSRDCRNSVRGLTPSTHHYGFRLVLSQL